MTPRVLVLGAGVAGLTTALALARGGVPVDVLERDPAAAPFGRRSAALWVRDGLPQAQHAHVFGSGCHRLLADGLPDVLGRLLEAGARELPPAGSAGAAGLALRRPLLDWVLRRTAEREPGVRVHCGTAVVGLRTGGGPVEVAVRGGVLTADLVVDARGSAPQRSPGPDPADPAPAGSACAYPATTYYSRGYVRRWPGEPAELNLGPASGGDFEGYACRAVPGDGHSFTVTFAVPVAPGAGRLDALRVPDRFQVAAERVPGVADRAHPGAADPIGGVAVLTARPPAAVPVAPDRPGLVAVGDVGGPSGMAVERGVAVALAQGLACASAVLAAGGVPADLPARVRAACPPSPPAPPRRPRGGPSADDLARLLGAGAEARVSV